MEDAMRRMTKGTIIVGIATAALSGVWLLNVLFGQPAANALPALTATPLPETPVFSATLSLAPSSTVLQVGDILTVTAGLTVAAGCQYPVFELTMRQTGGGTPIFSHVEPPGDTITGPAKLPSAWTYRAMQPGEATFWGETFGERYCNDFWNWHYEYAHTEAIRVIGPHRLFNPFITKE